MKLDGTDAPRGTRSRSEGEGTRIRSSVANLPTIRLSRSTLQDADNLVQGVFWPLTGFCTEEEVETILGRMRLPDGAPWPIPIVLSVSREVADPLEAGERVLLADSGGTPYFLLHLREKYAWHRRRYAAAVYGTTDERHPGVAEVFHRMGEILLAGPVERLSPLPHPLAPHLRSPAEIREEIARRGFRTVVAFQTRNVPHLGHEHLQKTALGLFDGLLIHPLVGRKKVGDFQDRLILEAYEVLIRHYFQRRNVILAALPTAMRYAGPREAVFHALIRKNYGCTHIVIGRDHAGVGGFYPPEAAIEIFETFDDLGVTPLFIRGDFFHCKGCGRIESDRTCPHGETERIPFSGTRIRTLISEGKVPEPEIMRPEVYRLIAATPHPFVTDQE
ncbi:MAG: sulfate adenylyltransferase [Deltaproteobacteria bacterium]|nr:MAG: sulfate adenylyltransferase [Deltaproteobacteria bacterium]